MDGGESKLNSAIIAMLDELIIQATLSGTPHHFIYKVQQNSGVGSLLDEHKQIDMLHYLHNREVIVMGLNMHHEGDGRSYFVELEGTKDIEAYRDSIHNPRAINHTAILFLEDINLKVSIDDGEPFTIRRFQDVYPESDSLKLFTQIFNKRAGHVHRVSEIFPNHNSLTRVVKDAKLGYLIPIFFNTNRTHKELELLPSPVTIDEETHSLLLGKIKEKQGKANT